MTNPTHKSSDASHEIVVTVTNPLENRFPERPESPLLVAIHHLRRRKVAMVCFWILVAYFTVAALSYLRLPGEDLKFVGEWFEDQASYRHLDPLDEPIDFEAPRTTPLMYEAGTGRMTAEMIENWGPPPRLAISLGTDIQGRSVFWRTLYGARLSLTIALGATLLAICIGTTLGAIAGYVGGWVDVAITWLFTTVASIPRILLILALAYSLKGRTIEVFGHEYEMAGVPMLILAMGLTTWVSLCRVIRGEIMKQKSMDYESAARSIGMSKTRILVRHLLPNAMYLVIIQSSLIFPLFIHLEVILSYLGLGVDEGISWGQMINASLQEMIRTPPVWWQLAGATVAIFGISLSLNLFGDALRDALDPRLQYQKD